MLRILFAAVLLTTSGIGCCRKDPVPPPSPAPVAADDSETSTTLPGRTRSGMPSHPTKANRDQGFYRMEAVLSANPVRQGNVLKIEASIRNTANRALPLTFANGQRFDAALTRDVEGRDIVAFWSSNRMFQMHFLDMQLKPGEVLTRELEFPTVADPNLDASIRNADIPLGKYWLRVWCTGHPIVEIREIPLEVIAAE